ncbi:MAG TPA: aminopeptidase P N-terminal domain-containing protein [Acidimicrobiia bacterium]
MTGNVFAEHRNRFMAEIGESVAVLAAGTEAVRNRDVDHPFRQDSDFYFLTGFHEPEAVAIIDGTSPEPFVLFVRPKDREDEIWTGLRAGPEGAREHFGANEAFPIGELESELRRRLQGRRTVYHRYGSGPTDVVFDRVMGRLRAWHERTGSAVPVEVRDPFPILAELRLRKTPDEANDLRNACAASVDAHAEAMRFTEPGLYEYQIQAALEYVFRMKGSYRNGYQSIVAGGPNACILHYTENGRRLEKGDLLLIDAGAEYEYHAADITRTFPVNGEFSPPQRALYEVVLAAHRAGIAASRPGSTLREVHEESKRALGEGLVGLGLVPLALEDTLSMHLYREYFMHGTSHWLGMDVHDVGTYRVEGAPRPLEPGMAFTVEPGLYVPPGGEPVTFRLLTYDMDEWGERRALLGTDAARQVEAKELEEAPTIEHPIPKEFRGIGIRIEDDVLITMHGCENLTSALPTGPDEIEAVCAERSLLPVI